MIFSFGGLFVVRYFRGFRVRGFFLFGRREGLFVLWVFRFFFWFFLKLLIGELRDCFFIFCDFCREYLLLVGRVIGTGFRKSVLSYLGFCGFDSCERVGRVFSFTGKG